MGGLLVRRDTPPVGIHHRQVVLRLGMPPPGRPAIPGGGVSVGTLDAAAVLIDRPQRELRHGIAPLGHGKDFPQCGIVVTGVKGKQRLAQVAPAMRHLFLMGGDGVTQLDGPRSASTRGQLQGGGAIGVAHVEVRPVADQGLGNAAFSAFPRRQQQGCVAVIVPGVHHGTMADQHIDGPGMVAEGGLVEG